jgi:hypothetical protein
MWGRPPWPSALSEAERSAVGSVLIVDFDKLIPHAETEAQGRKMVRQHPGHCSLRIMQHTIQGAVDATYENCGRASLPPRAIR